MCENKLCVDLDKKIVKLGMTHCDGIKSSDIGTGLNTAPCL